MWHWTETFHRVFFCEQKNHHGHGPGDRVVGYSPDYDANTSIKKKCISINVRSETSLIDLLFCCYFIIFYCMP